MTFALTLVFVMAGGSLGALARFLGQRFAANHTSWPGWVPILIINVLGSLMIGAAVAWLSLDIKALKLEDLSPFDRASDTLALGVVKPEAVALSAEDSKLSAIGCTGGGTSDVRQAPRGSRARARAPG